MDSSGLKYKSMEQLLSQSSLTEQQTRMYEQKSLDVIFKSMKSMITHAEKARGDLEEQYRLLILAGELANVMRKKATFSVWSRDTANASLFKANYEKIVEDASKLQSVLKIKYESAQVRQDKKDRAAAYEAEKRAVPTSAPATMRSLRPFIAPRELIRRVEVGDETKKGETKKSALIFDLRQNQSDAIFYDRSEMITVIQVPYDLIDSTLTFQTLRTNLAVTQRTLLARLSNSDYVVLMDDDNPELVNNSPAPKTKMSFLFKALTLYNHSERPKERPMFMEGGFKLWKDQYPMYTKNEQPLSARSLPSDDLDQVIVAYHKYYSEVADIRYPDLMLNPIRNELPPGQPSSPPKQPIIPPRPQIPPEPLQEPPKPGMGVYPTPTIPQRPTLPPFFERPGPPIFNTGTTEAISKPLPPQPAPVFPVPDRTSKPTTFPERSTDQPPTLLDPRQNGGGDIKRPPLLDRGTKPTNTTISKENEIPIVSIYEQMTMAIERSIDERTKSRGPGGPGTVGLHNMGNTCFMSATLQCLFQTPGLPEVFTRRAFVSKVNTESRLGSKGVVSAGFASLVDTIWIGKYAAIRPARFLQLFADEVYRALNDGRQHDASEFQIFLLDALHEDTNQAKRIGFEQNYRGGNSIRDEAKDFLRKHYQFSSSPVSRNLGSISVSEIRCLTCGESSATFEENTIVSVELKSITSCSLDTCLRSHFSPTKLEGDSCWNCPKCKQPRASTRTSKLWQPPPVLIIHLKRFVLYNGDYEKNTAAVTFEHARLDIRPYLHEAATTDKPFYKLYATTLHNGRLNSGHYTAVASHLKNDKWHRYDDETVRACDKFDVDPSLAYILFYKRC
uniref:Ubiquitin carboxyl-terminal hydrolase n=1 Tax=Caenorhabditis tropicalis TaxID=1561998 RepID=A0A1I7V318_9PELO